MPSTTAINNTHLLTDSSSSNAGTNQVTQFTNTWSSLIQPVQIQAFTGSVGPTFSIGSSIVFYIIHQLLIKSPVKGLEKYLVICTIEIAHY